MYVFIFLGKKDNFGVFEEIFGDFWDCDHYVRICGICCYLIELSHDKAKLSQHVIQVLINFRHSEPKED